MLLFLASIVVTLNLSSIEGAWRFLLALGSGTGLVLILRWYWWRINAWSEIAAMVTSMVVSLAAFAFVPAGIRAGRRVRAAGDRHARHGRGTTAVWLAVTFLTAPEPDATLDAFYTRVRPGGPGWARVSARLGFGREPIPGGAMSFLNWVARDHPRLHGALRHRARSSSGAVPTGLELLGVAAVAFVLIMRNLRREEARRAATGG